MEKWTGYLLIIPGVFVLFMLPGQNAPALIYLLCLGVILWGIAVITEFRLTDGPLKSFMDKAWLVLGIIGMLFIVLVFIVGISNNGNKSCEQAYQEAWEECNDDYNGKCRYLGPKYEPDCIPGYED